MTTPQASEAASASGDFRVWDLDLCQKTKLSTIPQLLQHATRLHKKPSCSRLSHVWLTCGTQKIPFPLQNYLPAPIRVVVPHWEKSWAWGYLNWSIITITFHHFHQKYVDNIPSECIWSPPSNTALIRNISQPGAMATDCAGGVAWHGDAGCKPPAPTRSWGAGACDSRRSIEKIQSGSVGCCTPTESGLDIKWYKYTKYIQYYYYNHLRWIIYRMRAPPVATMA